MVGGVLLVFSLQDPAKFVRYSGCVDVCVYRGTRAICTYVNVYSSSDRGTRVELGGEIYLSRSSHTPFVACVSSATYVAPLELL